MVDPRLRPQVIEQCGSVAVVAVRNIGKSQVCAFGHRTDLHQTGIDCGSPVRVAGMPRPKLHAHFLPVSPDSEGERGTAMPAT